MKVTVPEGVPKPLIAGVTVAVKFTGCPKVDAVGAEASVVEVPTALTVNASVPEFV